MKDDVVSSDDALAHLVYRRPSFSRSERKAYAERKRAEELLIEPKHGLAPFLEDPSLLPKKPPGKR